MATSVTSSIRKIARLSYKSYKSKPKPLAYPIDHPPYLACEESQDPEYTAEGNCEGEDTDVSLKPFVINPRTGAQRSYPNYPLKTTPFLELRLTIADKRLVRHWEKKWVTVGDTTMKAFKWVPVTTTDLKRKNSGATSEVPVKRSLNIEQELSTSAVLGQLGEGEDSNTSFSVTSDSQGGGGGGGGAAAGGGGGGSVVGGDTTEFVSRDFDGQSQGDS